MEGRERKTKSAGCFWERFGRFCQAVIWLAALVCLGVVMVLNVFFTSEVAYVWTEDVSIRRAGVLPVLCALLLFAVFASGGSRLERLDERKLFGCLAVLCLAAGLYWVLHVGTQLRMDADSAHQAAVALRQGDFSFLERGQDIYRNEHQLGLVTYEYLLGFFSEDVRFQYFVNLLEIIGIDFVAWRMTDRRFGGSHRTNLYEILFSFLFLPQFFFLAFAYGIVPGLFFMLLGFWCAQCFLDGEGNRYMVLCILCLTLAVTLKGNQMVGALVIAILCFLAAVRERRWKFLLWAVLLLVCVNIPGKALHVVYEQVSGCELAGDKPAVLYIAMGTEPYYNNMPGWYNGYNDWTFGEADYDPQKAAEMALKTLKDTAFTFRDHPDWMVSFFTQKLESMWCDPLYESLWSGPLPDAGARNESEFLNRLYSGESIEPQIAAFMKAFVLMLLVLAVCRVFRGRGGESRCNDIWLYFVGGFLLHILWEAKSQYVYPYVFLLLPCCAHEMAECSARTDARLRKWGWLRQKERGRQEP